MRELLSGGTKREREPWTSTAGVRLPLHARVPQPAASAPVSGAAGGLDTGTVVERAPWVDAVHGEGGTLVLVGDSQVRLGPLGEVLWRAADRPVALAQAGALVVAALGEHPDADRLVADGVGAMLASGVLRLTR